MDLNIIIVINKPEHLVGQGLYPIIGNSNNLEQHRGRVSPRQQS